MENNTLKKPFENAQAWDNHIIQTRQKILCQYQLLFSNTSEKNGSFVSISFFFLFPEKKK